MFDPREEVISILEGEVEGCEVTLDEVDGWTWDDEEFWFTCPDCGADHAVMRDGSEYAA